MCARNVCVLGKDGGTFARGHAKSSSLRVDATLPTQSIQQYNRGYLEGNRNGRLYIRAVDIPCNVFVRILAISCALKNAIHCSVETLSIPIAGIGCLYAT